MIVVEWRSSHVSLSLSFSLARLSSISSSFLSLDFFSFFLLEGGGEVGRDSAKGGLDPHHVEGKTKPFDTLRKKKNGDTRRLKRRNDVTIM